MPSPARELVFDPVPPRRGDDDDQPVALIAAAVEIRVLVRARSRPRDGETQS